MIFRSSNSVPRVAAALALLAGCSSSPTPNQAATSSADSIDRGDQLSLVLPSADVHLQANIGAADVGNAFGVPDDAITYPFTYWPFTQDGIDQMWSDGPSPLEKFM